MAKWMYGVVIAIIVALLIAIVLVVPVRGEIDYEAVPITVRYGDTLTGYAIEYAPEMPVQKYIAKVREMNGLTSGMIYAGDELVVLKEVNQ